MGYLGSSHDTPSPTAMEYVEMARAALQQGEAALENFMSTELSAFARAVSEAGIGLFGDSVQP
jgi:hypothetical protein